MVAAEVGEQLLQLVFRKQVSYRQEPLSPRALRLGWRSALSQGYLPPTGSGLGLPTGLQCLPTRNHLSTETSGPASPFLPDPFNSPFHSGSPLVTLAGHLIFLSTPPPFPILGLQCLRGPSLDDPCPTASHELWHEAVGWTFPSFSAALAYSC